jgi:aryl-alcohol dehydrogenase-like predicted oxidoreductase
VPQGATTAQFALRWILDQPGVTTVIPGARNRAQVLGNVAAARLDPLSPEALGTVRSVYDSYVRNAVHDRW